MNSNCNCESTQLWQECDRCGGEPVHASELCDNCCGCTRNEPNEKIDNTCLEPYRRGIGQGFGSTEDGE
jgi:hypothetical protein